MRNFLPKTTRLKSKKDISFLFLKGKSIFIYPIKVNYCTNTNTQNPCFVFGISASKRNFSKAVTRNKIKRLLRECIRLNKNSLETDLKLKNMQLKCMFTYVGKEIPDFNLLQQKIILTLQHLKTINEPSS